MKRELNEERIPGIIPVTDSAFNILMVEDNMGDVLLVSELIKASGVRVTITNAGSIKEAATLCSERLFDVILLDLGLPESTGLETLKLLLKLKIKSPVIVMTGLDDEDIALASLREGAQDYLVKNKLFTENILRSITYSIERKKIRDLLEKHTSQFLNLSTATSMISRCEDIPSIFKVICCNIKTLLGNAEIITVEFKDQSEIRVSCHEWLEPWIDDIRELTGIDIKNPVIHLPESVDVRKMFQDGKLHEVKNGIYDLFAGTINESVCSDLENKTGTNYVYVFGFIKEETNYGGALIFSKYKICDDDINNLETLISHTALSIHRRVIENDLRLSELKYKELNIELEKKVIKRTSELEILNAKLQLELGERWKAEKALQANELQLKELIATKDKFFNIVAHDLKNPFTSLMGSSELLNSNVHKMKNEDIKELAMILNDSAKSGYSILQNLLDWSRSKTGILKYNPERLSLNELIDQNIHNFRLQANNKGINLFSELTKKIVLTGDFCMINTILRNLISNAIKFTFKGGSVSIGAVIDNPKVIVSVRDTGVGIPPEDIVNLFRIDVKYTMPGTEKEQGTGLGLKLCKEFALKQGGDIWVESVLNSGSEFKFSIPLN